MKFLTTSKKVHWVILVTVIFILASCSSSSDQTAPVAKSAESPETTLEKLSDSEVRRYYWDDDLNFEGISDAVKQSFRYYERLPDSYTFNYVEETYTLNETKASMNLFLKILEDYEGRERLRQLQEKFQFYESKNEDDEAFFTGYYEPILEGSVEKTADFPTPLYERPKDLIQVDLGAFSSDLKGKQVFGKIKDQNLMPYDTREEIVYQQSLDNRTKPIVFVKNEIESFFLQIQGSGMVRLRDGSLKRVNYATQNGQPYRAIGRVLKDQIPIEKMSLQTIKAYLYAHPNEVQKVLTYNPSYVFFREVDEGPLGNIEVPLTPERSVAMDWRIIPKGGLVFIDTVYPDLSETEYASWSGKRLKRFAVVQDTGGAINGHGRVDIFWGNGKRAEEMAGRMKQSGRVFLLIARKEFLRQTSPAIAGSPAAGSPTAGSPVDLIETSTAVAVSQQP